MTQNHIQHCIQAPAAEESVLRTAGTALWAMLLMTLLLGFAYPAIMTGAAQLIFPHQAAGSFAEVKGKPAGSSLIGQDFSKTGLFESRPSAAASPYDAAGSSGTNYAAGHPRQLELIAERARYWKEKTGNDRIPADLLTASASGLDPHISLEAARFQADAVARSTGIPRETIMTVIDRHAERVLFGSRKFVNVLELNLAMLELLESR